MSVWMWTLLGILAFVLLLVVSFLFSHVEVKVVVQKSGKYERIWLGVRMWYGLIRWRTEVRSIQFKGAGNGFDMGVNKKHHFGIAGKGKLHEKKNIKDLSVIEDLAKMLKWMKMVKVDTFIWDTEIGLDEAPVTAIATGAIWSGVSYITGLLTQYLRFHTLPRLEVQPNFGQMYFSTRVVCISRVRIAKAITAVVALIFSLQDFKGGLSVWQNIQSKV
ncbi:DUF2953 domain-containing protein [Paenibacillus sp. 1001270B_150601_E10]|uniref:DUF2953 domain-containing protein n=1 Tax=Paenibacillus sp. 1001270B_150601_E10 TaxID=2787079 RepID=UPI001E46B3FD|nr:DUF2953 domain-containing protein [Paenibacillus sp. 1001270B_150601_E10]